MDQIPLFLDEFVLLNDAAIALGELRLDAADVLLNDYINLYSGNKADVEEKLRIVAFLRERLASLPDSGPELPGLLCQVWRSFESFCGSLACNPRLPKTLRLRFFGKIVAAIESAALSDDCLLVENIPIGYAYMEAGQDERAVRSLQPCLLLNRDNATIFGYLGDAWWGRGSRETARQIYFEACLIAPCALDWRHLRDEELKNLLECLGDEYGWEPSIACEWLPACAYIRGIFKPKMIRALEEFSVFTEKYRDIQEAFHNNDDPAHSARLFTRGLVLCDNEPFLRNVRGVDFTDIRREMKTASPVLFGEYMKDLERKRL
jgi:hypothetical protein